MAHTLQVVKIHGSFTTPLLFSLPIFSPYFLSLSSTVFIEKKAKRKKNQPTPSPIFYSLTPVAEKH